MKTIGILGSGHFGTALAEIFASQTQRILLWCHDKKVVKRIKEHHQHPKYFTSYHLHEAIDASCDLAYVLEEADVYICALPSTIVRNVLSQFPQKKPKPLMMASKGIEEQSLLLLPEVVQAVLGPIWQDHLLVLSGPNFAVELMEKQPAAAVLAANNSLLLNQIANKYYSQYMHFQLSKDVIGVSLVGALKNILAIGTGLISGLGYGHNSRSLFLTAGLADIQQLLLAKGGDLQTLLGLAGFGDILLTCTGGPSRNRHLGEQLGQGKKLQDIVTSLQQTAEGLATSKAAYGLAQKMHVKTTVLDAVYHVLQGRKHPTSVLEAL